MLQANEMWTELSHTQAMAKYQRGRGGNLELTSQQPQWLEGEKFYLGEWLEALDIKPAKLAIEAEVNEGYLSQLISGDKTNPSPTYVRKLAAVLDIPWRALFDPPPTAATMDAINRYGPKLLERLARVKKRKA